jgi:di/tricarboxylate transporter
VTTEQAMILGLLAATLGLFLWGRWRHDVVALAALLAATVAGLVPAGEAFAGFGHPAVITVACVLVLSRGLQTSGAVDLIARAVIPGEARRLGAMAALTVLGAALSAFMNNVGALALLMPVAVQQAGRLGLTHGQMLMPLAFGTILGGMTTLVGTPPNLIVSGFREAAGKGAFGMFDFTPVGLAVAAAGLVFILALGWRLVPARKAGGVEAFATAAYLTELRVPDGGKVEGMTLRQFEAALGGAEAQVLALVRNGVRLTAPHGGRRLKGGDILAIEADVEGLAEPLAKLDLKLEEDQPRDEGEASAKGKDPSADGSTDAGARLIRLASGKERRESDDEKPADEDIVLRELAVLPGSSLPGRSATELLLRTRYGLNLLAISREGRRPAGRLRGMRLRVGDVLLMQGPEEVLADFAIETGCVPLAERALRLPDRRSALMAVGILGGAVVIASLGLLPTPAAFALGVLAAMVTRIVPPRSVYGAIDWPVIVLLAALIPVAGAMETTGAAQLVADLLVAEVARDSVVIALAVILVVTMFLSDVMNNAATAAVMCPVAIGIAAVLGADPDAFLMAVAIGASCAFLTPIGHQNNTLILGPGGFSFGDYWRLGLPLEAVVVAVALPMLLLVWPP